MFSGSVNDDLAIMLSMLIGSIVISLIIFFLTKRKVLSFLIFSLLGNLSVYSAILVDSFMFRVYDLFWLKDLAKYYWPILNVLLLAILIFNYWKNVKNKK